jgi:hypothetical protein
MLKEALGVDDLPGTPDSGAPTPCPARRSVQRRWYLNRRPRASARVRVGGSQRSPGSGRFKRLAGAADRRAAVRTVAGLVGFPEFLSTVPIIGREEHSPTPQFGQVEARVPSLFQSPAVHSISRNEEQRRAYGGEEARRLVGSP